MATPRAKSWEERERERERAKLIEANISASNVPTDDIDDHYLYNTKLISAALHLHVYTPRSLL